MQKIVSCLWFNDQAEEAMQFYTSVFKNSRVVSVNRVKDGRPAADGPVLTGSFVIDGQEFMVLNGGPQFTFSPAISFFVRCETQAEIDELWEKLSQGGQKEPCGWLRDQFGVSWQIVPTLLEKLLYESDPATSQRVMEAMLRMGKIEIEGLQRAAGQA